jgi:catechol 2,3-dioxygenase-like lactoylglutathione lyase family enzyme
MRMKRHPDVFVLSPIGGRRPDDIYRTIIKPVVEECHLTVRRADDDKGPRKITDGIFDNIRNCRFVIANMTGLNANVFYELGFAHALKKLAVLVVQESQEKIPFDIKDDFHVKYNFGIGGLDSFRTRLKQEVIEAKKRTAKKPDPNDRRIGVQTTPSQIQHVSFLVDDWKAARDFYRDVVGLEEMDRPDYHFYGAWFLLENGQHLHIVQRRKDKNEKMRSQTGEIVQVAKPFPSHLAFCVKDWEGTMQRLSKHVKIIPDPCPHLGISQFYFRDAAGNLVEVNDGLKRETKEFVRGK